MTKRGFMDDLSSEAQSARARKNRNKTPWRCGPICCTKKAHERFKTHNHHQTQKGK